MTKEEMIANLEEQRSSGTGVGNFANIAYFTIGNPITDSLVVNAYAKTNSAAFHYALKNGGIYANHTVFFGNFGYNFLYNRKFTGQTLGIRNISTGSIRPFEHIPILNKSKILRNFSLNFISSKDLESSGKMVAEAAEKMGFDKTSEVVRTGWGFGKNYSGFFGALKDLGYSGDSLSNKTITVGDDTIAVFDDGIMRNGKINKKIANKSKHAKTKRRTKVGKKPKMQNTAENSVKIKNKGYKTVAEKQTRQKTLEAIEWNASNFSDDLLKIIKHGNDEKVIALADEFVKLGGKIKGYTPGMKIATKEFREELAGGIGKFFATRTTFQKLISSPLVRIATGAAVSLPAAVAIPLTIATTAVGIAASAGQENAVNNFLNSHLYNTNQFDNYTSEEATASLYSASNIRDVNLQTLYNSYAKVNVANRYLNDLSPISSDYSFELDDAEIL